MNRAIPATARYCAEHKCEGARNPAGLRCGSGRFALPPRPAPFAQSGGGDVPGVSARNGVPASDSWSGGGTGMTCRTRPRRVASEREYRFSTPDGRVVVVKPMADDLPD